VNISKQLLFIDTDKGVHVMKKNDLEQPKNTPQRIMTNDGLDTSTAKMLLNTIKKTQTNQAQSTTSNKEGKK
jgi:hypothetical protein